LAIISTLRRRSATGILDRLEQAGLVIEQQDHGIGRIDQRRAAAGGQDAGFGWCSIRRHVCFSLVDESLLKRVPRCR
jgi:hypothetical protein